VFLLYVSWVYKAESTRRLGKEIFFFPPLFVIKGEVRLLRVMDHMIFYVFLAASSLSINSHPAVSWILHCSAVVELMDLLIYKDSGSIEQGQTSLDTSILYVRFILQWTTYMYKHEDYIKNCHTFLVLLSQASSQVDYLYSIGFIQRQRDGWIQQRH